MPSLRTPAARCQIEIPRIKGSRFIAVIERTAALSEADAVLAAVQVALPGATHYAHASRIDARTERVSDDGEVRGTAGRPILARLTGQSLLQVTLVVVRYYGGTKLGKGGLVRAYGEAASAALAAVEVVEEPLRHVVTLTCSYALAGKLQDRTVRGGGGGVSTSYDAAVTLVLALPVGEDDLLASLLDHPGVHLR